MNTVEAIKDIEKIRVIKERLESLYSVQYRELFEFGLNAALRISDLLEIKFEDVKEHAGDLEITLKERKTGKTRLLELNDAAARVVRERRKRAPDDVWLFQSRSNRARGAIKPLSRGAVAQAFKAVGECASVQVALGTHSMRKTRGYHLYKQTNNLALVQKLLNHSSSAETLRYIGLNDADVSKSFSDLIL